MQLTKLLHALVVLLCVSFQQSTYDLRAITLENRADVASFSCEKKQNTTAYTYQEVAYLLTALGAAATSALFISIAGLIAKRCSTAGLPCYDLPAWLLSSWLFGYITTLCFNKSILKHRLKEILPSGNGSNVDKKEFLATYEQKSPMACTKQENQSAPIKELGIGILSLGLAIYWCSRLIDGDGWINPFAALVVPSGMIVGLQALVKSSTQAGKKSDDTGSRCHQ